MANPEHLPASPENNLEAIGEAARNRSEELRSIESGVELSPESAEQQAEKARAEALEAAVSVEAGGAEKNHHAEPAAAIKRAPASKARKDASFNRTMTDVQHELTGTSRSFSKIIHHKTIEATSEAVGRTIARPSAIVAGSSVALVFTFAVYMIAKFYGYPLSGFETIGAFVIGWMIGIFYDFGKKLIYGSS